MAKRKRRASSSSLLGEPAPPRPSDAECRDFWHTVTGVRTATCPTCQSSTLVRRPLDSTTVTRPLPGGRRERPKRPTESLDWSWLSESCDIGDDGDSDDGSGNSGGGPEGYE